MNRKARWRLGVLLAVLLLAVAALGASVGKSARQGVNRQAASNTLIDGTTDTVVNIDPAASYDLGSQAVQYEIFQHLLEAGPGSLVPRPVLATKCAFQGNLKTFACSLRHGVKFHNGHTMTSADVKWSFDRVVKIKDPSGIYTLLADLKSVATKGKYGVVFHLKAPQATFPQHLTTGAGLIVPKGVYPANKARPNTSKQIGTGPYELTKFVSGQLAVFKKFKNYWGTPAKTQNLIIRYYSKSSTMKLALQNKDIDMAFREFTPTEYLALQKAKGIVVHKGNGASIRYLVLNVARAPTNKLAVRKAIAYLMPRQTIASRVYHGLVSPLYTMVAAGLPGHVNSFALNYGKTPSQSKAKAMLSKAGISTPVNLTLWYTPTHYGDASADEYAEIQRALQAGGLFKVTLQSAEWATYSKTLGTQYGAFQLGWFPDYVDAENYLLPFYPSCKDCNFTGNNYKNAKVDSLMAKEQATKSNAARIKIVQQVEGIVAKDAPIIPYWQAPMIAVSRNNVKGVGKTLDPTFIMRFYLISKS